MWFDSILDLMIIVARREIKTSSCWTCTAAYVQYAEVCFICRFSVMWSYIRLKQFKLWSDVLTLSEKKKNYETSTVKNLKYFFLILISVEDQIIMRDIKVESRFCI
jgi:hypothetical protein